MLRWLHEEKEKEGHQQDSFQLSLGSEHSNCIAFNVNKILLCTSLTLSINQTSSSQFLGVFDTDTEMMVHFVHLV